MSTLNTFPYDTPSEDNLYRVRVNKPTNSVEVTCVSLLTVWGSPDMVNGGR